MRWKADKLRTLVQLMNLKRMTRMLTAHNPQSVSLYSDYLAYRCQLALYEIWSAESALPWEDFIAAVHGSAKLKDIAKEVAKNALISFDPARYDFELAGRVRFFEDDPQLEVIYAAPFFTKQEGEFFVHFFMLQTEISHLSYLRKRKGLRYRWEQYMDELTRDDALRLHLIRAYQKALTDLDFEECWMIHRPAEGLVP
ncbi:MAG: hypothetical protein HFE44_01065 [Oscillospiraceae bacterium]|nr:hypothetical protein [Oscillospiraceae bacterium]